MEKGRLSLICDRRTIREIIEQNISTEEIAAILKIASYAPFHSAKEPWRVYTIVGKQEHEQYAHYVMASYDRIELWKKFEPDKVPEIKEKLQKYFESIPVSLIVTRTMKGQESIDFDAMMATAAFIQNIQLAAWEYQIGVTWRTTPNIFETEFQKAIQISEDEKIIGVLSLTRYEGKTPKAKMRQPLDKWVFSLFEQEET